MPKINRDGIQIYYEVHSSGPPLLLTQRDARVIESLPDIKVPSLVVVGADDTPFLAASDYMAAKIPGAKKAVVPAAGHAVNIDQPQAFIDAVLPFLDSLPRSAVAERMVQ